MTETRPIHLVNRPIWAANRSFLLPKRPIHPAKRPFLIDNRSIPIDKRSIQRSNVVHGAHKTQNKLLSPLTGERSFKD